MVGVKFLSFWEIKEIKEVREVREVREREEEYAPSGSEEELMERGIRATLGRSAISIALARVGCFRNRGAMHTNTQKHAQTRCVPMCAMCILCAPNSHKINFVHTQSHLRA